MLGQIPHCRRSRRLTASIAQTLSLIHMLKNMVLNIEPGSLILRLILNPHKLLDMGVFMHFSLELLVSERIQLFYANNRHIVALALLALFDQIIIDPSRTNHDASDLIRLNRLIHLTNNRLEVAISELLEGRIGPSVTQQGLGRHQNQRLAERTNHLTAQDMKDLRCSGRLYHLHIIICTKLQKALDTSR